MLARLQRLPGQLEMRVVGRVDDHQLDGCIFEQRRDAVVAMNTGVGFGGLRLAALHHSPQPETGMRRQKRRVKYAARHAVRE